MAKDNNTEWRNIPGYDNHYWASRDGRVWSDYKNDYMTKYDCDGYHTCHIKRLNGKNSTARIHRLVAIAFLGDGGKLYVNHKDGNKTNNCVENLEWVTARENALHSVYELDNGQNPKRGRVKLTEEQKQAIIQMKTDGHKVYEILEKFNISSGMYRRVVKPPIKKIKYSKKKLPTVEGEILKLIPGYEYYYASNLGNIYSMKSGIRLSQLQKNGYLSVRLHKNDNGKNFLTHRIVALTFLGNPPKGKTQVNHKNRIKNDNHIENLEWVSRSENLKQGMQHTQFIEDETVVEIRSLYKTRRYTLVELAKQFNLSETSIGRIVHYKGRFAEKVEYEKNVEWKTIPGFEDYEISNTGIVWDKTKNKEVSLWEHTNGCLCVDLIHKHKRVHRLVLLAFVGKPPNGKTDVFHKDGDIKNNNLDNLEYCSRSDTIKRGRHKNALTDVDIDAIRKMHQSGEYTLKELREHWGLSQGGLCSIIYYSGNYKNRGSF